MMNHMMMVHIPRVIHCIRYPWRIVPVLDGSTSTIVGVA
jgi:hypothetical protein